MELGNLTIADCVKAGWSPADVKELIEMTKADTQPTTADTETTQPTEVDTQPTTADTETTQPTEADRLKEELEKTKAELIKTTKSLADAQKLNRTADFSNKEKSDEDIFSDFVRNFN